MKSIFVVLLASCLFVEVFCHSYLTTPISRGNQRQTQSGCRPPSCPGPCELPASSAGSGTAVARGASVPVTWPRNNHPGGFIRFAWAPTSQSDTMSVFDNNVDTYWCFETPAATCAPSDPNNPNGGDTGAQFICGVTATVPGWLTDGKWTLQWAWFGGGYGLADYYGCVDFAVSGGPSSSKPAPVFFGGDYTNQVDKTKCKFFNTDRLHVCNSEPCTAAIYTYEQQQNGPVYNVAAGQTTTGASLTGASTTDTLSGSNTGDNSGIATTGDAAVACNSDTQCSSGVCQSNGYCYIKGGKSLDGGGIAAIVFAMLFVVLVAGSILFVLINRSEWSNWKPFKSAGSTGYGFKGSVNSNMG